MEHLNAHQLRFNYNEELRDRGVILHAQNHKANYTMLRCSKNPVNHYGFSYINEPCIASCGGRAKWYLMNGETHQVIRPA